MFEMRILVFVAFCLLSNAQNIRGGSRRNKPKPRPSTGSKSLFQALTINYPLHFFHTSSPSSPPLDRRTHAHYNEQLVADSEPSRAWSDSSFAQDQEDVWLYENWFYGMSNGLIMESGALNGILFSNSYMFENFANWTAIHVGEYYCLLLYYLLFVIIIYIYMHC